MSFRLLMSRFVAKKVPALSLILVAIVGMVAGVLAATMVVGQNSRSGEAGTFHNNAGTITITDNGLAIIANTDATNNSTGTVTWGATGTNKEVQTALTAGNWMEHIDFTTSLTDTTTHTVTITIRNGTGPVGSTLASITSGLWTAPSGSTSTAKITFYIDLGTQNLTAPVTVYVNVS